MNKWLIGTAGVAALGMVAGRRVAELRSAATVERELTRDGPEVLAHGMRLRLPVAYHRSDGFSAIVGAERRRVIEMLPSDTLLPVVLPGNRAAMYIGVYRYHEVSMHTADGRTVAVRPYGEVIIGALVTRRPAPPVLPVLAPRLFGLGCFVLHLPVTTRFARDGGMAWWGLPKFVADMDFTDDEAERSVALGEGGHRILTLRVAPSGGLVLNRSGAVLYSELAGSLLEIAVPGVEVCREHLGSGRGSVELGDHPLADELRAIGLGSVPVATTTVLGSRFVLPAGRQVGSARTYTGYAGANRDFGRFSVRHAGTPAIDLDASWLPLQAWPAEPDASIAVSPFEASGADPAPVGEALVATGR